MRLSFSTLGCPGWTMDRIVDAAAAYGYDGVEIRGIQEHVDLRESPHFRPDSLERTRRAFADRGLAICCLGSSASFADPAKRSASREEALAYLDMAAALGCPFVRVFGGMGAPGVPAGETERAVADCLTELAPAAAARGVKLALETHDSFSTGKRVAAVLRLVGRPEVGALWDLHHPFREGEAPEETARELAPHLIHTHVKDSRDGRYCLLGEGDVPIRDMIRLATDYATARSKDSLWISLEWEKRWHPEIEEPEVVFPQYAAKLREYLGEPA